MKKLSPTLKIIFTYFSFGSCWIFYSDNILATFLEDIEQLNSMQSYKGWFFILLTSLLLYFLIKEYEKEKDSIEEELNENKERYKSLLEQSPYAIEVYNKDGLQVYANEAHVKLWGFEKSVMVNKLNILTDKKFVESGLLPFVKKAYDGEIIEIPAYTFNPAISTSVTDNKGKEKLIKTQIYPIKNFHGVVQDIVVTHIDVSAEANEKRFDNLLSSIFKTIPDILFIMKNDGTIIDYRAQTNDNLYLQAEFFINKKMQDVLPEDKAKLFEKYLEKSTEEKNLQVFDYALEIGNEEKNFEARMSVLPDNEFIMMIVRDITENVKSKEQIKFQSVIFYFLIIKKVSINTRFSLYYRLSFSFLIFIL